MTGITEVLISYWLISTLQLPSERLLDLPSFLADNENPYSFTSSEELNYLIADQDPSKGWSFCNRTSFKRIDVAVGFTVESRRISMGWRSALKNNCNKPLDGERPSNLSYYAVARNDQGKIIKEWKGNSSDNKFCLSDNKTFQVILETESQRPVNCKRLASFMKIPKSDLPIVTTNIK